MKKVNGAFKKIIGIAMSAVLVSGSLWGCGNNSGSSLIDQATSGSKEYVFRSQALDFLDGKDYSNLSIVGDKIYALSYAVDGYASVYSFNSDGSDLNTVKIPEAENESHGYVTYDGQGNMYSILNVYSFSDYEDDGEVHTYDVEETDKDDDKDDDKEPDTSDSASTDTSAVADSASTDTSSVADSASTDTSAVEDSSKTEVITDVDAKKPGYVSEDSEEAQYLVKLDGSGKELFRIKLGENLKEDEYLSVYSMIYVDGEGLILSSSQGLEKYDENGKFISRIIDTTEQGSPYYQNAISLYKGFNGTIFCTMWGDSGLELRTVDLTTGAMGEKSSQFTTFEDYSFFCGNGYDLYAAKSDGFYGYDQNKDTIEKILDYSDSDLNISYAINTVVAVNDNEFIANIPDEEYNYSLCKLTKVNPEDVKDKTVITLAGNYVDYNVRQKVFKFNQESEEYKIKIVDYSKLANAEDYNAGMNQFNLDIVSGNTPDIMYFSAEEPVDSYINKGLFIDLTTYIRNDPDLANAEFVENIVDAMKTGDKLYQIMPSFYVTTVSTKAEYVKDRNILSIKECEDMIKDRGLSMSGAFGLTDKSTLLYQGLMSSGNLFIDWENKKCNFDGEEFINLIKFVNQFPDEITEEMWQNYEDTAYMKGDSLFSMTYLSGFRAYRRYRDATFASDIAIIGFPNDFGIDCSVILPEQRFAISAQSKYADAAWSLVRQFLLPEYQDTINYAFPILKSSYDRAAEESMDRPYYIDSEGKKQYEDDIMYLGDKEIKVQPLTKEDVEFMKNYIGSLSLIYSPNQNLYNIITEEVSAYFSGQKSAEEVADIIQSRASIYVNENS